MGFADARYVTAKVVLTDGPHTIPQDVTGDIAWETEVWVSDAPGHLIHFNGERFLGPYEAASGEE